MVKVSVSDATAAVVKAIGETEKTLKEIATDVEKSVSGVLKIVEAAIESGHVKLSKEVRKAARGRPAKVYALTAKGKKLAAK